MRCKKIFCETSKPTKRVINEPPMVRITEQRRPDRGTIGRSSANRDYRMSTHVAQMLVSDACLCNKAAAGRSTRSGASQVRKPKASSVGVEVVTDKQTTETQRIRIAG
jgi:hypothetical protein